MLDQYCDLAPRQAMRADDGLRAPVGFAVADHLAELDRHRDGAGVALVGFADMAGERLRLFPLAGRAESLGLVAAFDNAETMRGVCHDVTLRRQPRLFKCGRLGAAKLVEREFLAGPVDEAVEVEPALAEELSLGLAENVVL